jgi:hypothetical protein
MRAAEMGVGTFFAAAGGLALVLKSVPQTGQRVAVSDKRVPHVGHT